ncbi:MAG: ABC transporter, partial [Undibacterium sp.]|nr:ABC transporter [Undibacterium sp.]
MTISSLSPSSIALVLPPTWSADLTVQLEQDEIILNAVEIDLDARLNFEHGLIAVTNRRLISKAAAEDEWQTWRYTEGLQMRHHDHGGVGHLELFDTQGSLAHWRFTLGQNLLIIRLMDSFREQLNQHLTGKAAEHEEQNVCPSCKAILEPDQDECPVCTKVLHTPPSTWTLFRLWRFAHPYRMQLFVGFALMLFGTAAHMIPRYLTKPLTDEVLIPYQNGVAVDPHLVALYIGGLLGAAILAWLLSWGKTYILALVSERIAADLRTATYEHLLKLSLEYFGSKRTGDLMSRIGSGSDRISVYLSLHLLDFATDVLMFIMTAGFLLQINVKLALVTLLPLPFIAWAIHLVRDKLRTGFEKIDRVWGEVTNVLSDTIPGIRVVKAFAQEQREARRFHDANKHNLAVNDKLNKAWSLFSPIVSFLTDLGILVVWGFGIWQVAHNEITVGALVSTVAFISNFYGRIDSMSRIVSVTQKSASAAKRIFDILDHVSSVPEPQNPVAIKEVKGQIELREVGFRYGNRAVNRGINLSIQPGEMIGLVGHSGS